MRKINKQLHSPTKNLNLFCGLILKGEWAPLGNMLCENDENEY